MKKWLVLLILILCSGSNVVANMNQTKPHPIDIQLQKCLEKDYTTTGMNQCVINAENAWLKEIEKYAALIQRELNDTQKEVFTEMHKRWLEYYKYEQKLIDETIFTKSGTINTNYGYAHLLEIVKDRAENLKYYQELLTH